MKHKDIALMIQQGLPIMKRHDINLLVSDIVTLKDWTTTGIIGMCEMAFTAGIERGYAAALKDGKQKKKGERNG